MEGSASTFAAAFTAEYLALREQYGVPRSFDLMFVAFVRATAKFRYVTVGPISLDVRRVEEAFERRLKAGEVAQSDEFVELSEAVIAETTRAGRSRVDELDYLFAFMRRRTGLAAAVFGELGVTPEQVALHLRERSQAPSGRDLDRIMTPEEVAEYLKVHVHTVRGWIREGRLPARRILGLRSLRVRAGDVERLLRPLAEGEEEQSGTGDQSKGE